MAALNTADAVLSLTNRLPATGARPVLWYKAGACGYGLHCLLTKHGFDCTVVAQAKIPRRAGDRIKADRRDAEMLARLWRAGELTIAKQQLLAFCFATDFRMIDLP